MSKLNDAIINSAIEIDKQIKADAFIIYADLFNDLKMLKELPTQAEIILVTQLKKIADDELDGMKLILLPIVDLSRMGLIKVSVMMAISAGYLTDKNKVICLSGLKDLGFLDALLVVDLESESEIIISKESLDITDEVRPEVFARILSLSVELAKQGREGEAVGTIFVLGDHENVLKLSSQLIMNPFHGHPEEKKQILNPNLRETIKEFSSIDGAFIIRGDGVLLSSGRHLNTSSEVENLTPGLGCRHAAAAGITALTKAVAIVISQSTGSVRIFRGGKVIMKIEKTVI